MDTDPETSPEVTDPSSCVESDRGVVYGIDEAGNPLIWAPETFAPHHTVVGGIHDRSDLLGAESRHGKTIMPFSLRPFGENRR